MSARCAMRRWLGGATMYWAHREGSSESTRVDIDRWGADGQVTFQSTEFLREHAPNLVDIGESWPHGTQLWPKWHPVFVDVDDQTCPNLWSELVQSWTNVGQNSAQLCPTLAHIWSTLGQIRSSPG